MKLSLVLIFVLAQVSVSSYSQIVKFTLDMEKVTLSKFFNEIENSSDFRFFYDNEEINPLTEISVNVKRTSIENVLADIFTDSDISYEIFDSYIILKKKESVNGVMKSFTKWQKITIKGKITDIDGNSLLGVNIVEKGTTNGVMSNLDGEYTISVGSHDAILNFSFVGFLTEEIEVSGQTTIDVMLIEDIMTLDEVVVIGYGTMKKQDVTGAVTKANLKTYENVAVNNILERVKGSVPGLNVEGINNAGALAFITIRGQNSLSAGNSPLIVVDGAVFNGTLADIAVEDIEGLTVLKDASAAAVYGSRAANGVILIETKKGRGIGGKPIFNVKTSYGISNQLQPLELYDADGYLQYILDQRQGYGFEADPNNIRFYLTEEELKNYDATEDHQPTLVDPFSLISQMGYSSNTLVSIANSTEKAKYYISTSFIKQKGVVIYDDFKHVSVRVNIDNDLTDWFKLGLRSFYSLRDYSGDSPGMERATHFSPYASVYNDDGSYKQFPQTTTSFNSPFWEIATEDIDVRNNLTGILSSVIKVPWIEGLSFHTTYSNSIKWNETFQFFDENTIDGKGKNGLGSRNYTRYYNMLLDNLLQYNKTFSDMHRVDVTLLFSREHSSWENISAYAEDFDNSILGNYALEYGATQTVDTGGGETDAIGMMARGTYSFSNKYSLTGTIRRDGYSAFSLNKKWGVFPSVGFNWSISQESFMQKIAVINNLAFRASYGKNGNQSIDPYSTLARVSTDEYIFYGEDSYTIAQYISTLANNDLGWESTTGTNLGSDFAIFDNRINGSLDVYRAKTNDLIFELSLPTASGKSSINSNIGEIKNKGVEFSLSTLNLDKGDFKWYSDFAFSLNRNEVVSILGKDDDGDGKEDDLISDGYFIGESLGTIYTYKVTGMWQQEDEDNGTIMSGMRPGDFKLEDINGDGAITSDNDRQIIGNTNPNFWWSFTNTLQYKKLSLMFYIYSIWGGNNWYLSGDNDPYNDGYVSILNVNHPVYDYWTPTNTDAEFPRTNYKGAAYTATKYIDRSFIKLQKVSLTYDATNLVKPYGINGLSFSLSADNLGKYAPYWNGLDPETNSGLSDTALPSIRTWLLSIAFNF